MREWKPKAVELVGWIACHSLRIVNSARDGRKEEEGRAANRPGCEEDHVFILATAAAFNLDTHHNSVESGEPS